MQPLSGSTASPRSPDAPPALGASPAWRQLHTDGIDWVVHRDAAHDLLSAGGLRWEEWKRLAALEIVKTGPHRTVYRLDLPGGTFYLKHFRIADWRAALRNLFRLSPAERELQAVQRIAALRLPTFDPVALGVRRLSGVTRDTWLVSRAIPGAVPLDHFLLTEFGLRGPAQQAELRQRLAREMGRLAARLHTAGIEHIDLHAGNLLIRPNAGANEPLLSLIDLHAVRFRTSLATKSREVNLAALHQFFAGRSTRADRRRFWRAYAEAMRGVSRGEEASARRIERILADAARAGWQRADRAWKRGNRHVRRLDAGAIRCRGLAALDDEWLKSIRDAAESVFDRHLVRWCKRSGRNRVAEVAFPAPTTAVESTNALNDGSGSRGKRRLDAPTAGSTSPDSPNADPDGPGGSGPTAGSGPELRAYWKAITEPGSLSGWFGRWRLSPVRRAWETGHALLRRGIDTPRPLLYVERPHGAGRRLYLLTESVPESVPTDSFFRAQWTGLTDAQRASWLKRHTKQLACQMRRLHNSGFDHRDLKFPNLLVSTDLDDDRIWLLDLDAVRRWPRLPRFRAIQNVARLNVSASLIAGVGLTNRLRFLRWYLGTRFGSEWKSWWMAIAEKSRSKMARNHRRARPLS